jgi:preprotein translocase subunit SecE
MQRLTSFVEGRTAAIVLAVVFGVANAWSLFGPGPLDPRNITWLFGDTATYYSAWSQYRHDPHLHFPLAWTERAGYPIGASIAMMDAFPIVAILLRPLSPLLPNEFQYVGLYSIACFVLQAYFGLRLCQRLFPSHPAFIVFGSVFFLLSAPLTWRALGHQPLMSHWLILAALDCYFHEPGDRPAGWFRRFWVVLAIAPGVNPYVAAMSTLVSFAGLARLLVERRVTWPQAATLLAGTLAVLFTSAAVMGVLLSRDASAYFAPGYGQLSLNLNAIVNPMDYGSILLPQLPVMNPMQIEGYNYLGLGIIALLVVGVLRRPAAIGWLRDRRVIPLVALAVVCTALAMSTTVSFGSSTLFEVPLPRAVSVFLNAFRVSGRFFWPTYYLLTLAALSLTFWSWKGPVRVVILLLALGLQAADLANLRRTVHATNNQRFDNVINSPVWKALGEKYDNVILVPPFQCDPLNGAGGPHSFVWFGRVAAAERMRLNAYYAARAMQSEMTGHCLDLLRTQLAGTLDGRSAYVVTDAVQTVLALAGVRSHRCERVDVFNLCTAVDPVAPASAPPPIPAAAPYALGRALNFTNSGDAAPFQTFGWGPALDGGTWTQGPMAMLRLGIGQPIDASRPLLLELTAGAFLVERQHPRLHVDVVVNGQELAQWLFPIGRSAPQQRLRIPAELVARRRGLDIELRIRNPASPLYLGVGPTSAFLGLNVQSLTVRYEW